MNSVLPVSHYLKVTVALLVLLLLTIGIAYVDLGPWNGPIALLISVGKAALILLFFMHLRSAPGLMRLGAGVGFFWLLVMIGQTLSDYLTRG